MPPALFVRAPAWQHSRTDRPRIPRMPTTFEKQLVIAISSRALFDMAESHRIFEQEGVEAYCRYQMEHEEDLLQPGVAFTLVRKLLALNEGQERTRVEVILLSRNSADTGLRVFNSIEHYGLNITRAAFTNGESPYRYVPPFGAHLFLSADPSDVVQALNRGYAAATILPGKAQEDAADPAHGQLRIAFDGDAVLFSDAAERVFRDQGLDGFSASERAQAREPLPGGPFKSFLAALHALQAEYPPGSGPIRTALVTARAAPAHERVIRTLRGWNIRIDEALFLGGLAKAEFLAAFGADIFFDDQQGHCEVARLHVATGHVPHGVANEGNPA
jgi:5'-nucleotidase